MTIHSFQQKVEVQEKIVRSLSDFFIVHQDAPLLFFYSGGSAMELYPLLYERIKNMAFKELLFAPLDERKDPEHSNYVEFKKLSCYAEFIALGTTFLHCGDLRRELDVVADHYDELVKHMIDYVHKAGGKVVGLFGMGADGHTAGIFPYPENRDFFEETFVTTNRFVVGYDVGGKNEYRERITLTLPAFKTFDYSTAFVIGDKKKEALRNAVDGSHEFASIPARMWNALGNFELYSDLSL